jgi:hypothetical protein
MPQCVKCRKRFHPDWTVIIDETVNPVVYKCMFCATEKNELTVEDENGAPAYKVTKEQAVKDYDIYIKQVCEKETVQELIKGQLRNGKGYRSK